MAPQPHTDLLSNSDNGQMAWNWVHFTAKSLSNSHIAAALALSILSLLCYIPVWILTCRALRHRYSADGRTSPDKYQATPAAWTVVKATALLSLYASTLAYLLCTSNNWVPSWITSVFVVVSSMLSTCAVVLEVLAGGGICAADLPRPDQQREKDNQVTPGEDLQRQVNRHIAPATILGVVSTTLASAAVCACLQILVQEASDVYTQALLSVLAGAASALLLANIRLGSMLDELEWDIDNVECGRAETVAEAKVKA
jgi:hypothetical protein